MVYVFRCANGHLFEENQPVTAQHDTVCPVCGAIAKKDFGATARSVTISIPKRHRATTEIEATKFVFGETSEEIERSKRLISEGRLVHEEQVKDIAEDWEKRRQEEENAPRITKDIWEEAWRLTDGGRKPFVPPASELPPDVSNAEEAVTAVPPSS